MELEDATSIDLVLSALADQLGREADVRSEIVVIGGTALIVLGLVERVTRDIDVVALAAPDAAGRLLLRSARPLPEALTRAASSVSRDFGLPGDWLNDGPADPMRFGLPAGIEERLTRRAYGAHLTVHFVGRLDQIAFKLFAAVDTGGRHLADLLALAPKADELLSAARWSMTHDPSEGYKMMLEALLRELGHHDVAERL